MLIGPSTAPPQPPRYADPRAAAPSARPREGAGLGSGAPPAARTVRDIAIRTSSRLDVEEQGLEHRAEAEALAQRAMLGSRYASLPSRQAVRELPDAIRVAEQAGKRRRRKAL